MWDENIKAPCIQSSSFITVWGHTKSTLNLKLRINSNTLVTCFTITRWTYIAAQNFPYLCCLRITYFQIIPCWFTLFKVNFICRARYFLKPVVSRVRWIQLLAHLLAIRFDLPVTYLISEPKEIVGKTTQPYCCLWFFHYFR